MANPNISEIASTTIDSRSKEIADNITTNHVVLNRLSERGRIKPWTGGEYILQELSYQENSTAGWYTGTDLLNISATDVISAARYSPKQASVAVQISGLESMQNNGKEQMIDLLDARMDIAESSAQNLLHNGVYATGTGSGGKELGGLQLLVPDDPTTGTVGGINRATYTFWRSLRYRGVTDGGAAVSAATIQRFMRALYFQLVRGTDKPDLICADNNYYGFFVESLQPIQITENSKLVDAGFTTVKFLGSDVVLDGGFQTSSFGSGCPSNHMYMLDTKYLFLRPHTDRNWTSLKKRESYNQDSTVAIMVWGGAMTLSNARLQGVLIA